MRFFFANAPQSDRWEWTLLQGDRGVYHSESAYYRTRTEEAPQSEGVIPEIIKDAIPEIIKDVIPEIIYRESIPFCFLDSRFRGNDRGSRGNDRGSYGNDREGRGNDRDALQNDILPVILS